MHVLHTIGLVVSALAAIKGSVSMIGYVSAPCRRRTPAGS